MASPVITSTCGRSRSTVRHTRRASNFDSNTTVFPLQNAVNVGIIAAA